MKSKRKSVHVTRANKVKITSNINLNKNDEIYGGKIAFQIPLFQQSTKHHRARFNLKETHVSKLRYAISSSSRPLYLQAGEGE